MKKMIMACVALLIIAGALFAQSVPVKPTIGNTEIAEILAKSKEVNYSNGIVDINRIYPGDKLTFLFQDGSYHSIVAEQGDNMWHVLKYKLSQLVEQHGEVVPFEEPKAIIPTAPEIQQSSDPWWMISPFWLQFWGAVLGMLAFLLLIKYWGNIKTYFAEQRRRKLTDNPVVPGGVSADGARAHINTLAQQYFPGLNVTNIVKGRLTAKNALVSFSDKLTGKTRSFENEPGYRGTLTRENGTQEYIYFLEICGNRARQGDYYSGGIQFVADVDQPAALQQDQQFSQENSNAVVTEIPALSSIITAIVQPMNGADNGKLKLKVGDVEIDMEFSSNPKTQNLLINGSTKDQMAPAEVVAS
jgi:hypothetical protein